MSKKAGESLPSPEKRMVFAPTKVLPSLPKPCVAPPGAKAVAAERMAAPIAPIVSLVKRPSTTRPPSSARTSSMVETGAVARRRSKDIGLSSRRRSGARLSANLSRRHATPREFADNLALSAGATRMFAQSRGGTLRSRAVWRAGAHQDPLGLRASARIPFVDRRVLRRWPLNRSEGLSKGDEDAMKTLSLAAAAL